MANQASSRQSDPWALRVYRQALRLYPASFRQAFGEELWQTFRDEYEATRASGSAAQVVWLWRRALIDLLKSASGERISVMRPMVIITALLTGGAFVVSLLASLNLYLLEDQNPLTPAAYHAAPLLQISYDVAYLSALAAGALICGVVARTFAPVGAVASITVGAIACVIALGGFGGLLLRAPLGFLALAAVFALLVALGLLVSGWLSGRLRARLGARPAAIVGACAGAAAPLLVNVAALAPHTLALNPISHALYMQGTIPGSHVNSLLIGMLAQVLIVCLLSVSLAMTLREPGHRMA